MFVCSKKAISLQTHTNFLQHIFYGYQIKILKKMALGPLKFVPDICKQKLLNISENDKITPK